MTGGREEAGQMKCFFHPDREVTHIINHGTAIDLDTPACDKCAEKVKEAKRVGMSPKATVRRIDR
jgi:hypothetical protein